MSEQLLAMLEHHGVLIVFATVLVGQLGVPIPAIMVLIGAGALAADGEFYAPGCFAAGLAACLIADSLWFVIGRHYGVRVLKTLYRVSLTSDVRASRIQRRFERWGAGSLVLAKFIPGLATIAPPLAGALRTSWPRFLLLSGIGSVLWVAAGLATGIAFTEQIPFVLMHLESIGTFAAVAMTALAGAYIVYRYWSRPQNDGAARDR
jgi:membrane protein DedA with SNARE-associated domain